MGCKSFRIRTNNFWLGTCLIGVLFLSASCSTTRNVSSAPYKPGQILSYNVATKTADITLVTGEDGAYGGFNFDGYSVGELSVKVPIGWKVNITCRNNSLVLTHTCAIVKNTAISPVGGQVVFGATSPNPLIGLSYGVTAKYSFTPNKLGKYRIACLVVGHEADGMWDWFYVTNSKLPSVNV
ncbi:MAG: hypothetical protein M1374_06395 [Firmicutes bacterium]|nr:hypothetical protein [Bacillota bacterium]